MPLSRLDAIKQVSFMCQAGEYPELTVDELGQVVDDNKRFDDWSASTSYVYGDIVAPIVKNGRTYKCIEAGTSGTVNPFPEYYSENSTGIGYDDNTVKWIDLGPAHVETFDIRSAARAAWILKAAKVSNLINSKDGSQDLQLESLQKQFLSMAERYRPVVIV
jgi:hypothetical protein